MMDPSQNPSATRRKNSARVRLNKGDPSHPRVGLHTSQTRRTCAANGVPKRPDATRKSNSWDALTDGGKTMIRGREYVCLGWVPVPNKAGISVAVRLWGECTKCGAGFDMTSNRRTINEGYPPKVCPAHRRPVITRAGLRP
jgi:hypothetical protein